MPPRAAVVPPRGMYVSCGIIPFAATPTASSDMPRVTISFAAAAGAAASREQTFAVSEPVKRAERERDPVGGGDGVGYGGQLLHVNAVPVLGQRARGRHCGVAAVHLFAQGFGVRGRSGWD